jgi:hypothetical protein
VKRAPDRRAENRRPVRLQRQVLRRDFNNGTEFGLYYLNYHSRLPLISGRTGSAAGIANAWGTANAAQAAALGLAGGLPPAAAIARRRPGRSRAPRAATAALRRQHHAGAAHRVRDHRRAHRSPAAAAGVGGRPRNLATHEYAKTARYFVEYPEDIQMIGLSFNTQIQRGGIALQGELTYRKDVPLQYDDVELLFAALTPFEAGLGLLNAHGDGRRHAARGVHAAGLHHGPARSTPATSSAATASTRKCVAGVCTTPGRPSSRPPRPSPTC